MSGPWTWLLGIVPALTTIAEEYDNENRQLRETIERLRVLAANRPDREARAA